VRASTCPGARSRASANSSAEDGAGDVAPRIAGLLAESRRGLEPRERQEPEDDAEEQRRGVGARGHGEDREVDVGVAGRVAADHPHDDHYRDQQDERDGDALDAEEDPRGAPCRHDGEQQRQRQREARPDVG
jgi:hypothetical protein